MQALPPSWALTRESPGTQPRTSGSPTPRPSSPAVRAFRDPRSPLRDACAVADAGLAARRSSGAWRWGAARKSSVALTVDPVC